MPRSAGPLRWLTPGIGIKRWLFVALIGAAFVIDAIGRAVVAEGSNLHVNEVLDAVVDDFFPPSYLTWIFLIAGVLMIVFGVRQWARSLVRAASRPREGRLIDALIDRRLQDGYKIVAIGGGTGLSTLLRGLKRRTSNLAAIVTVADDGGSSGRLRQELGVLPPGDIRNCLVALADDEALVTDLFRYRFSEGEGLTGHSFGNLFLAAMTGITGNFDVAIRESSRVLNTVGRVLPATLAAVRLCAEFTDGTTVEGESNIPKAARKIKRVFFSQSSVEPFAETIEAIREADAIVLGPGSLFTSVLPNLVIDRVAGEIAASRAVKMYVCNVMTQPGETDEMTAADHVAALTSIAGAAVCEYVIVNSELPSKLRATYAEERQLPVAADVERIEAMGMRVVQAPILSEDVNVRHDPERLADVVIDVIDRAVAQRASFVKPASAYAKAVAAEPTSPR
jgi:uncharacterized cofD-like protein